jgi:hypothetical protein
MSLAVERYRGFALPGVYEVRGERRLVVRRSLVQDHRAGAEPQRPLLPWPPRRPWRPEDAVFAYRASLSPEAPEPSIDLYA